MTTKTLEEVKESVFRKIAEGTRAGSGDDQAYVDSAYEQLMKDAKLHRIVKAVFEILKPKMTVEERLDALENQVCALKEENK